MRTGILVLASSLSIAGLGRADDLTGQLAQIAAGKLTPAAATSQVLDRAANADSTNAILALVPSAQSEAQGLSARFAGTRPPLFGTPIVVKDNIDVTGVANTAGSLALADNLPARDAPIIARLRAAGAVIVAKTNLSEWANIRSSHSLSGWSAVGGQTLNAVDPRRSPCGSSSGSGSAVASGLAAAAIGTETDGSITCPAAVSGLVGLKPTVGLVSRTGIIPISSSQDTAGPITLTVRDAALLLNSLAGSDPADPATKTADLHKSDYVAALEGASLKGVRVGVLRWSANFHPETEAVFDDQLARMKAAGAVLVEIDSFTTMDQINEAELTVLLTELKVGLAKYLEGSDPARVKVRSLGDIIAFNSAHADQELALFGQDTFEQAEATKGLSDPAYVRASALARRLAGPEGIDALLKTNKVEVLVAPTMGPSWLIDPVLKDHFVGGGAGTLAAVSGYPHLTVPMGKALGMPVGMSFIGPEWSEARLLRLGAAFEALQGATAMR